MEVAFEPHLLELAVRRSLDRGIRPLAEAAALRELQGRPGLDRQDPRRAGLHERAFRELGLDRPFLAMQREFPEIALPVRVSLPDHHEGCFLPDSRTALLVRVAPDRFDDLDTLQVRLRHEWLHASDMLRPDFAYPAVLPALDPPVRHRLGLLWSVHVDARLERRGSRPWRPRAAWQEQVLPLWASVDLAARLAAFDGLWDGGPWSHAELLAWARDPRELLAKFARIPVRGLPGGRCPLCDFSTFHWTFPEQDSDLAALVRAEFPAWSPERGLCERCVELYEIRSGHW